MKVFILRISRKQYCGKSELNLQFCLGWISFIPKLKIIFSAPSVGTGGVVGTTPQNLILVLTGAYKL